MVKLDLTLPPSSNHRLMASASGRGLIKAPKYRAWMQTETTRLAAQMQRKGLETIKEPVTSLVYVTFPDRRKRDLDNVLKAVNDVLVAAGVIKDDSLITTQITKKGPVIKSYQGLEVRLWLKHEPLSEAFSNQIEAAIHES